MPAASRHRPAQRRALAAVLAAAAALGGQACDSSHPVPHSVVLVSLDTLRADHLGAYGYPRETSPNVDALAASGVLFERAITQASSTLPAHRSLFRSRDASRAGSGATLAEVLGANGFRTAAFTGGGNVSAAFGFGRGFERYVEDPRGLGEAFDDVEIWLRGHADERFLLFVHTYDIHLPYDPPPPYDERFAADYAGSIAGNRTRELLRKLRRHGEYARFEGRVDLDDEDRRKIVALYDGGIAYTDTFVGRLLLLLRELDLDDRTAIVVFSDHGEEFWEHGSVLHSHTLFQELVHVPLIFALPGKWRAGTRIDTTVRLMDVAPTVLELLGLAVPPSFEGRSLVGLMSGETTAHPPAASEIRDLRAWIEHPWKLIREGAGPDARVRLFHLVDDPGEQRDVSAAHGEVVARLRGAMDRASRSSGFVRDVELEDVGPDLRDQLEALGYVDE